MKKLIRAIYRNMQENYIGFVFLVRLKEMGITRYVNHLINHSNDSELREKPSDQMMQSKVRFGGRSDEVLEVLEVLADDKSRYVWKACVDYRTGRIPISKGLFSEGDQYFPKDIIKLHDNEVFIDCGAYTGDTIQQFINECRKSKIKNYSIVSFEPSKKYYELASKFFMKNKNVRIINKGVSDTISKDVPFDDSGEKSKISLHTNAASHIDVTRLDDEEICANATFIKMDIEGAELSALRGAYRIITGNKPKLAICIYHSDSDMIDIIKYVHEIVPEYQLFVRHHSRSSVETVLYAI